MPKMVVLSQTGKELNEITLADTVFGIEPNQQCIFDAVIMQRASMRQGTHDTKNRTEVRGGGRKPWRQKGTGRARQGSIRATQWRGGGIVFGPTPRNYGYKLNKKVRRLALKSALSEKVLENAMSVVDKFELEANLFAMELLLPDSFLDEYRDFTIDQISRMTGYHKRLIELRISS